MCFFFLFEVNLRTPGISDIFYQLRFCYIS